MMVNKASAHLQTLGNSICTRNSSATNIYLFKVNNRNTKRKWEICSKLTVKTQERLSTVFIFNFEQISHLSHF